MDLNSRVNKRITDETTKILQLKEILMTTKVHRDNSRIPEQYGSINLAQLANNYKSNHQSLDDGVIN